MYFPKPGPANTEQTIKLAVKAAQEKQIDHIVVASYSGDSVRKLLEHTDRTIICVTSAYGSEEPGKSTMLDETRAQLEQSGVRVLATSHVLSGVERGLSTKHGGIYPAEIMSHTLRMFGQGSKVCVEVAIMALDAGLIPYGKEIIALGGTAGGIDTALLLTPAHANNVLKTKIHEIICKPY